MHAQHKYAPQETVGGRLQGVRTSHRPCHHSTLRRGCSSPPHPPPQPPPQPEPAARGRRARRWFVGVFTGTLAQTSPSKSAVLLRSAVVQQYFMDESTNLNATLCTAKSYCQSHCQMMPKADAPPHPHVCHELHNPRPQVQGQCAPPPPSCQNNANRLYKCL